MTSVLRLDPSIPVVWRTPHSLQLGGDPPRLVLERVTNAQERMLDALRGGVTRHGLAPIGKCSAAVADAFLDELRPFLLRETRQECSLSIRARGAHQELIGATARTLGLLARAGAAPPRRHAGVIVGMHAIPAAGYRDWLRRDLPHVGVVFGDAQVAVSHVVIPGRTACLRCADLHRRDRDPSWPVLAAQLIELPATTVLDGVLRAEALIAAARRHAQPPALVRDGTALPGVLLRPDGSSEPLPEAPHEECGCTLDLQRAG